MFKALLSGSENTVAEVPQIASLNFTFTEAHIIPCFPKNVTVSSGKKSPLILSFNEIWNFWYENKY